LGLSLAGRESVQALESTTTRSGNIITIEIGDANEMGPGFDRESVAARKPPPPVPDSTLSFGTIEDRRYEVPSAVCIEV
jgi:hypothetical protein